MAVFNGFEIQKGFMNSSTNELVSYTGLMSKIPQIPSLLAETLSVKESFESVDFFQHDLQTFTTDIITDSPYHDRGNYVSGETVKTYRHSIPHFALQAVIRPQDRRGARMPGTENMLDTSDRQRAIKMAAMRRAWDMFQEKSLAYLIVEGKSYIPNGTIAETDWYSEYTGAVRPTAIDYVLATSTNRPASFGEQARTDILNALRDGDRVDGFICLCGNTFFEKLIGHAKTESVYTQRSELNQDPLVQRLGNFSRQYRMFMAADGILYVNYNASIGGTALIGASDGYVIPTGNIDNIYRAYAPADTEDATNTIAVPEYMWEKTDNFKGINLMSEKNVLHLMVNPLTVRKVTTST